MEFTKNGQLCETKPPASAKMIFCLKIKKYCKLLTNSKTLTALPLLPFQCHKCIITYTFAMISIFFLF